MECGGTSSCPHPCRCADGIVDCREKSLINVPSELPDETTELWVSTTPPHPLLPDPVQLLFPVVGRCTIDDHMVTPRHIEICKNILRTIFTFFTAQYACISLILWLPLYLSLSLLPVFFFQFHLISFVCRIECRRLEQNFITEITPKAFANFKRLRRIDLSNNNISRVAHDAFAGLKSLTTL